MAGREHDEDWRLAEIVRRSYDFIGTADPRGRATFINRAGRELVGIPEDRPVESVTIEEHFPPEDWPRVRDEILRDVERGTRRTHMLELQHFVTGERIPVAWDVLRLDDPDTGEPVALATITRDLRPYRRVEAERTAVAELGLRAASGESLDELAADAVAAVTRVLGAKEVAVAERDGQLTVRAGAHTLEPQLRERAARLDADSSVLEDGFVAVPIPGRAEPFGVLAACATDRAFAPQDIAFLQAVAFVLATALDRTRLERQVRDAREAERARIARALHDETLHELSAALAEAGSPEMITTLRRIGEQIRGAIDDLRRADGSFAERLEGVLTRHPRARLVGEVPEGLAGETAEHVLLVVGEALTNAHRHAAAERVEVRFAADDESLTVRVSDDGRGFDPATAVGHGIAGMRERACIVGGELDIRSGDGTVVELRVPRPAPEELGRPIRVLLVDDHAAIREALAVAFAQDAAFVVAAQAGSLREARRRLAGIDVAVLDRHLPDGDGYTLIGELRAENPHANALVLSAHMDRAATALAVEAGASAVLSKTTHLHEVVSAVRRVRAGETLIPLDELVELLRYAGRERERELAERARVDRLTPREREILQLLAQGLDGPAVAQRLRISLRTQRNHLANAMAKLEVHSQVQALVVALRHGIVTVA